MPAHDQGARTLVAEMGEPLRFGSDDPLPLLYAGFSSVEVRTFDELALHYRGTYERARKMRFQSLVTARVGALGRVRTPRLTCVEP